ncbi:MAG: 4Fe-4S binding protein, partial [Bacteroidales bacterium]|nr:4Fe-4S binding protein [Bacteroidales bacterium]
MKGKAGLADFLDIYSGLLETVPLLLSSESRRDYISAEDIQLQTMATSGYLVRCSSRVPIDRQKCTWCRACTDACEEQCISSDLRVDFNHCNFCSHCVNACPTKAIDLYARLEKEFKVPAVIL